MRPFLVLLLTLVSAIATPNPSQVYAWFKADTATLTNSDGTVTNWQNQATAGTPANRNLDKFGGSVRTVPRVPPPVPKRYKYIPFVVPGSAAYILCK